jgi:hypothetical protein
LLRLSAIGFASVVSMIPGIFLYRMASGLVQLADDSRTTRVLISGTVAARSIAMLMGSNLS